jgi:hypothetical protein
VAFGERLQHSAAKGRQPRAARLTGCFGACKRFRDAALVVVIEGWKASIHRHLSPVILLHHIAR